MKIWTAQEVIQKIRADLDLQDELFITPDELVGYINEGIHEAESEILKISEDYFLKQTPPTAMPMTVGQTIFELPLDIYGQKIRGLLYSNGSVQYAVKRIRGANKFEVQLMIQQYGPSDDYMYFLINANAGLQNQIQIAPASRDAGNFLTLWYIRSAQRIPTAAEVGIQPTSRNTTAQLNTALDIPEFATFIIDFAKCRCLGKDSDPRFEDQVATMEKQRAMMVNSLTGQTPDDDDCIVPDMYFYKYSS